MEVLNILVVVVVQHRNELTPVDATCNSQLGQVDSSSSTAMSSKVSFTIRRPSPLPDSRATSTGADSDNPGFKIPSLPRHLSNNSGGGESRGPAPKSRSRTYDQRDPDDSDEEDAVGDELVTGFDRFGVQRCVLTSSLDLTYILNSHQLPSSLHEKKKTAGPLVIPSIANRDWRELARKRRSANRYVPASAKAETGADGSVGGLGTRDSINSGPQKEGIQVKKKVKLEDTEMHAVKTEENDCAEESEVKAETEDQLALRAILASTDPSSSAYDSTLTIGPPISETDAYKQDVQEFPEEATLDDYARVPVAQFGAALLRGMGWKDPSQVKAGGKKSMAEPWIPTARPALLGIGAKEQEVYDDGSSKGKKGAGGKRPEKRYVPLVKKERTGESEESASGSKGRERRDRSPSPGRRRERGERSPSPGKRRDRERERDSRSGRDREKERDRERSRSDRKSSGYDRERERDRDRYRERERDGDRRDRR